MISYSFDDLAVSSSYWKKQRKPPRQLTLLEIEEREVKK